MKLLNRSFQILKQEGFTGYLHALLRFFCWHPVIDYIHWVAWCLFRFKKPLLKNINGHTLKLEPWKAGIHRELFLYGIHEIESTRIFSEIIPEKAAIADIGANIGYFVFVEAKKAEKIYAIEPSPGNIPILRENVELNSREDRIEVHELAISNTTGKSNFFHRTTPNHHRLLRPGEDKKGQCIEVRTDTFDNFFYKRDIDVVRMDVEGAEWLIIQGMKNYIENSKKPLKIFMEVHTRRIKKYGGDAKTMFDYLFNNGFRITHIVSFGYKNGFSNSFRDYFVASDSPRQFIPDIPIPADNQANNETLRRFIENESIYCLFMERS